MRAEPLLPTGGPAIGLQERLEAARGHARRAWRPVGDGPSTRAVAGRIDGEVVTVVADAGEFDGDWSDPSVVQRALFVVVEGLRRIAPGIDPHFVVALSTFTVEAPTALYLPLANDVRGIGYRHLEPSETFRFTPGRLDGVVFMNTVRAADTPLTEALFLQELGHRWGVFVRLPEPDGTRLLGRDCAHWSHFVRAPGSAMEGEAWMAAGPGRFEAPVPAAVGYDPAQRYLMGALPADAVPSISLIEGDGWPCFDRLRMDRLNPRHLPPAWRTGLPSEAVGEAVSVPWSAVVEHEGARVPDHAASRKRWSAVFVLLANAADDPAPAAAIVDRARLRWRAAFAEAADGLTLDTTLEGAALVASPGSVGLGGRCLDAVDCAAEWPRCAPTESGDRVCTAACRDHADCGAGACCRAVSGGDAVCAPSVDPCPVVDLDAAGVAMDASLDAALDGSAVDGGLLDGSVPDGGVERGPDGSDGCAQRPATPVGWPLWLLLLAAALARRGVGGRG